MKKEIFTVKEYLFCIAVCIILFASAAYWLDAGRAYESSMTMTILVIVQAIGSYAIGAELICCFIQNYVEPVFKIKK